MILILSPHCIGYISLFIEDEIVGDYLFFYVTLHKKFICVKYFNLAGRDAEECVPIKLSRN